MTFLVKRYFTATISSFILISASLFGSCTEFGLSLFEHSFVAQSTTTIHECDLSPEEKTIYNQLGPVYKKIYLDALTDDQRQRVVIYVHRGLSPFDAINVILRAEQRRIESNRRSRRTLTPGERAALKPVRKRSGEITGFLKQEVISE